MIQLHIYTYKSGYIYVYKSGYIIIGLHIPSPNVNTKYVSRYHSSLTCLVSGQAQHGFNFFFSSFGDVSAEAGAGVEVFVFPILF